MAVEVFEIWSRQSDSGDSATIAYTVTSALSVSHARTASDGTTSIPRRGDLHPTNPGLWAGKPSAKRVGFNLYEVEVQYSADRGSTSDDTDPLAQPAEYEWQLGLQSVEKDVDVDGNPLTNSARAGFDQNPSITETQIFLNIKRNLPFFDAVRAIAFTNTVNNADLTIPLAGIVKAGQMKCLSIVPGQAYTVDSEYVSEIARFEIARFDLSMIRLLDVGFFGVLEDGGKPTDLGDAPPTGFRLNGLGGVLPNQGATGTTGISNVPGFPAAPTGAVVEKYPANAGVPEAVWLKWQMLTKKNFGDLGLFNV